MKRHRAWLAAALVLVAACSDSSDSEGSVPRSTPPSVSGSTEVDVTTAPTEPVSTDAPDVTAPATVGSSVTGDDYRAEITRTAYGIPHIVADDWGSLGFGQGYAFAEDRACTLVDQVIKVRGERAKWFGPGEGDANLDSDFAYRQLGLHDDADTRFADQPADIAEMVQGYVDGFNAELDADGPHGWCEGEPWVQPITTTDLYAYMNDVLLFASSGVLLGPIATAQPPEPATIDTTPIDSGAADGDPVDGAEMVDLRADLASNGWAIGSELSDSGGGMLLANPHFPWEGEKRLWESQLTLTTGELNVYGATLSGVPGVLIGFNEDVAWTHTVSAGYRMTLYELTLAPGDPTSFVYGDTTEQMTSEDITIDVLQDDGTTETVERTMWSSHYGPMLNLPFGWTDTTAYTMRDANIDNADILVQFLGMDAASSMDEFIDVHRTANGIPWVNTIATSADGQAWYADAAATPNLSPEAISTWQAEVAAGGLAAVVLDNGAILLDGSDPANEWVDDPAATRPGILPFDEQPQLLRSDYVFNANDSHWLANPAELLTGYSPLTGAEAVAQSARTRMNDVLLTDPANRGADGVFSLTEIQDAIFSNRGMHAELLLPSVLAACEATPTIDLAGAPYDLAPACAALRGWNGEYDVDSTGAALWREFMYRFAYSDQVDAGALYAVPFDPADPVGTPNTLTADTNGVLVALAEAATGLTAGGFDLDAPLGTLQYDGRAITLVIPLPGGQSLDGTASVVGCCAGSNTLAPEGQTGTFSDEYRYATRGYPVTNGNSFMMTLQFTDEGPVAAAVLTYGQPDDPRDEDFISQTLLYSNGEFRPILYTADDIAADPDATTATVTAPRP